MSYEISWSLVVAANSEEVLKTNLLGSDETNYAKEVFVEWNFSSASHAYNSGLRKCTGDVVVFAHQDIFLPPGWASEMTRCLEGLSRTDPNWGVVGIFGVTESGAGVGLVYSTGLRRYVGKPFKELIPVRTLDEIILIIRRGGGLFLDDKLPGFHLYGTDLCIEAENRGMRNYVIPCFALHNSNGIKWLPRDFWRAYMYLRKKWWIKLPIITSCTKITRGCYPIFRHFLEKGWATAVWKDRPGLRVADPKEFYEIHLKGSM